MSGRPLQHRRVLPSLRQSLGCVVGSSLVLGTIGVCLGLHSSLAGLAWQFHLMPDSNWLSSLIKAPLLVPYQHDIQQFVASYDVTQGPKPLMQWLTWGLMLYVQGFVIVIERILQSLPLLCFGAFITVIAWVDGFVCHRIRVAKGARDSATAYERYRRLARRCLVLILWCTLAWPFDLSNRDILFLLLLTFGAAVHRGRTLQSKFRG